MHVFRDGDTSQARSQWHFIALDADFHCMCRSAFFPDICELSHLFIQSTDTFLGRCLKLRLGKIEEQIIEICKPSSQEPETTITRTCFGDKNKVLGKNLLNSQ